MLILLLLFLDEPLPACHNDRGHRATAALVIAAQPAFLLAVAAAIVAYLLIAFLILLLRAPAAPVAHRS